MNQNMRLGFVIGCLIIILLVCFLAFGCTDERMNAAEITQFSTFTREPDVGIDDQSLNPARRERNLHMSRCPDSDPAGNSSTLNC